MIPRLPGRDNLVDRKVEAWQPPIFQPPTSLFSRWSAWARRLLDLQAASVWNDMQQLLQKCEGRFLDVGCGAQPFRPLLPQSVEYKGIDTADAKDHFGYTVPDTSYFEGDRWPVDAASMDVILATETLEHVKHPDRFLGEAKRCLKANGVLILTIPFAARWHYIPYDYWRFTPSGIRKILEDAGFQGMVVYARGNEITVACYKVMALILAMLLGHYENVLTKVLCRIVGLLFLPVLIPLGFIGQISLRSRGGNDCLGYTIVCNVSDD